MRRRRLVVILGIALIFATWGTARVIDSWRYRASLKQAKARIDAGSVAEARRLLVESVARWPGEGEATFLLGACEQALGRPDAAVSGPLPRPQVRGARWVNPELVGEVQFNQWTREGRLRQPVWRGLRPDKEPGDVVVES